MSSLTLIEKRKLEKLFDMHTGYVLDFSNRTFEEFVLDVIGKDIYDPKYDYSSGSKANRLRGFWTSEPDHVVAALLDQLVEYARELDCDGALIGECSQVVARLKLSAPVQELDAIEPNAEGRDFEVLAKSVRASIEANEPEAGLDRLHTFVVRYVRVLCQGEGIDVSRDKPLHSLFGELLKRLQQQGLVESEMARRILKSTISILEAFNDVRNNQSLAHDNPLLSSGEALLIFNSVANAIRFLSSIQPPPGGRRGSSSGDDDCDIPF